MLFFVATVISALASSSDLERHLPDGCAVANVNEVWCIGDEGTAPTVWPTIDLRAFAFHPFITTLALGRVHVKHPGALAQFPRLSDLTLYDVGQTRFDLAAIAAHSPLVALSVEGDVVVDIGAIASATSLVELRLESIENVDLAFLANLPALARLSIEGFKGLRWGDSSWPASLRSVHIWRGPPAEPVPLDRLPSECAIEKVDFYGVALSGTDALSRCRALTQASIVDTDLASLAPFAGLAQLTRLEIYRVKAPDLEPLATLTKLTELRLARARIADLRPLASLMALASLDLSETDVVDLAPLAGHPRLSSIVLDKTRVVDITPVVSLPKLEDLSLAGSPAAKSPAVATLRRTRPEVHVSVGGDDEADAP